MYWEGLAVTGACSIGVLAHQYRTDLIKPKGLLSPNLGKRKSKADHTSMSFYALRYTYVVGFTIMTLADWLQGPFLLPMYTSFGLTNADVAALYALDYCVGIVAGLASGGWTDSVGAKKACIAYGILYAASCMCNHFSETSMAIVAFGCAMDGLCNALLRTSFETWVVTICKRRKYADEWALHATAVANWWGAVASLLAGIVCHGLVKSVRWYGSSDGQTLTPFMASLSFIITMDMAALLLVIGSTFIALHWEDDVRNEDTAKEEGQRELSKTPMSHAQQFVSVAKESAQNLRTGLSILTAATQRNQPRAKRQSACVRSIILLEVAFEATLMLFIGMFPMTVAAVDPDGASMMGVVFVSLMGSILLGTSLANVSSSAGLSAARGWQVMCVISTLASLLICLVLYYSTSETYLFQIVSPTNLVFVSLCAMEVCFGFYYPYLTLMHNAYTSEGLRNSCVSIVRAFAYAIALTALFGLWITNSVLVCWAAVLLTTVAATYCSFQI